MPHALPPLPYAFNALEPHIDAKTMEIHHGKHHQAYVNNLNDALKGNADLAMLDGSGNVIVVSAKKARRGERVVRVVTARTYFIRVNLAADATQTPFKLLLAGKMPSKKELRLLA